MENDLILFCTRLWDINKTKDTTIPEINEKRISIIQQIRRHFPKKAIAGVSDSPIARKMCPDLILSHSITNRKSFIKIMNCATICIASTGLHKSTGWRFAEYIAAGKAIISEPLFFSIPGDFAEKKNYIAFNTSDQLVSAIDYLLSQPQVVYKMKMNNLLYFHHYIRPDSLVLNALSSII